MLQVICEKPSKSNWRRIESSYTIESPAELSFHFTASSHLMRHRVSEKDRLGQDWTPGKKERVVKTRRRISICHLPQRTEGTSVSDRQVLKRFDIRQAQVKRTRCFREKMGRIDGKDCRFQVLWHSLMKPIKLALHVHTGAPKQPVSSITLLHLVNDLNSGAGR
jgi:hypothetical protein